MADKNTSIMNEHWCRALLERDSLDYSKFYRNQLEQFLDVSRADKKKLDNILEKIEVYIHLWKIDEIDEKTMLILNDILLIKNGQENEVIRLQGSDNR